MPNEARPGTGEQAKQLALTKLRQAILRGEMAPAQRLVENELAEEFGVTRASIRAALIDLASEGLVERIRNRGSRVRVVSVEEAVAITECRMVLEGLCAAKAAVMATDEQLGELAELGEAMTKAVAGRRAPDLLGAQRRTAQPHPADLRPAGGRRTAGQAQRPAGEAPLPAGAAPRASAAVPERAPGHGQGDPGQGPEGGRRGRPRPPQQRDRGLPPRLTPGAGAHLSTKETAA